MDGTDISGAAEVGFPEIPASRFGEDNSTEEDVGVASSGNSSTEGFVKK